MSRFEPQTRESLMPRFRPYRAPRTAHQLVSSLIVLLALAACRVTNENSGDAPRIEPISSRPALSASAQAPTSTPTRTPLPPTPTITPTPVPWREIGPGVSQKYIPIPTSGSDQPNYVYALRFDPQRVAFRVHHDPEEAHSIEEWQTITRAPVILNGGFFGGDNAPFGRIIIDGVLYGSPLDYGADSVGVSGIFTVLDNEVEIYALGRSFYNPRGLRFDQAVECYPILVLPGGQPTFLTETSREARRTVIALDEDGNVIVLLVDLPIFSLYELANWLVNSDLRIDTALNLDGGRSSGLAVALPGERITFSSFVPVPIVIG